MNIHLPAILGFTRYQGFDPSPFQEDFPLRLITGIVYGNPQQTAELEPSPTLGDTVICIM